MYLHTHVYIYIYIYIYRFIFVYIDTLFNLWLPARFIIHLHLIYLDAVCNHNNIYTGNVYTNSCSTANPRFYEHAQFR